MKRTQIYLDDEHDRRLTERAEASGRSKSALIRQAIDAFLDRGKDEEARLRRFRTAVSQAAGAAPNLPSGSDYVDALRARDRDRATSIADRTAG
jgi:predicted transcriptional regulator